MTTGGQRGLRVWGGLLVSLILLLTACARSARPPLPPFGAGSGSLAAAAAEWAGGPLEPAPAAGPTDSCIALPPPYLGQDLAVQPESIRLADFYVGDPLVAVEPLPSPPHGVAVRVTECLKTTSKHWGLAGERVTRELEETFARDRTMGGHLSLVIDPEMSQLALANAGLLIDTHPALWLLWTRSQIVTAFRCGIPPAPALNACFERLIQVAQKQEIAGL